MPMRNPFRRPTEAAAPSLRERATTLRDRFASAIRNATPEPQPEPKSENTIEDFAGIEFRAYDFGFPIKTPQEWTGEFADRALMLHLADRTLRMTKPELMAFIREAGERDASMPETMFRGFDGAHETLDGWSNLLKLARDRYIVAASAECLEPVKEGNDEPKATEPPLAAPVENASAPRFDLAAVLLDGWATWRKDLDKLPREDEPGIDQRVDATAAPMNRLVQTAAALPATPENITAKALACAWMEWVHAERPGQPRDAYGPADQLVYDINAAITARDTACMRPVELPSSALVPTVDFTGSTIRQLWAIREAAILVCEVSNAKTWQGCNRLPDHPTGAAMHNEAGKLMRWVSDAMCHVAGEAEKEARRRTPENSDDRGTRLVMLAGITVDNEDPAEIAAFARELLAMVEP